MTYPLTDSTLVVAQRFFEILDLQKATLGLQDVWFGDQNALPHTPSVCVEPGVKRRDLQGVPDMTLVDIDTYFLLYHSPIISSQVSRREAVAFAEGIESYLHKNHLRLFAADGTTQLTIHGFCTDLDPGIAFKNNTKYHAVQITWTSRTKTSLQRLQYQ